MPSNIKFQRSEPFLSQLPSPTRGSQKEQEEKYGTLDGEVRGNDQFRKIAQNLGYNPDKVGYKIEKEGDTYLICLFQDRKVL